MVDSDFLEEYETSINKPKGTPQFQIEDEV
jgi:hypothetical protein